MNDWNDLRYFLAVARSGGLSPAAGELAVSPATVSRRIDALEQALGLTLFLRRQTGYLLTDEGERLLASALPVEQAMLGFERQAEGAGKQAEQLSGTVRVAVPETLASYWIAPRLKAFLAQYPKLCVELIVGVNYVNLSRRDADIAVRMAAPTREEEGEYIAQPLGGLPFAAYVAAGISSADQDWRTLPYLAGDDSWSHLAMTKWLRATFAGQPPALASNSMNVQYMAACQGLGVVVLPTFVGDGDARLRRVEPGHHVLSRELWMMIHRDLRASGRMSAMREFLTTIFRTDGDGITTGATRPTAR
ncbi:MAG: LysR family transcriptional regulator [Burkholderiales bacterium]|nr:LysR family transcriptional regulator [Burkholderiales bacterium]